MNLKKLLFYIVAMIFGLYLLFTGIGSLVK